MIGELALDGRLNPVNGELPLALFARAAGHRGLIVAADNATEAAAIDGLSGISGGATAGCGPAPRRQRAADYGGQNGCAVRGCQADAGLGRYPRSAARV